MLRFYTYLFLFPCLFVFSTYGVALAGAGDVLDPSGASVTNVTDLGGAGSPAIPPTGTLPSPLSATNPNALTAEPPPSSPSGGANDVTISDFLERIKDILDSLVPFIIGLAVFVVLWGIFTYITHAADEEKRAEAKHLVIYGILGVFFMLSVWGFVNILLSTFQLNRRIDTGDIPTVPTIK